MKIAVLGATGGVGRQVVALALKKGHSVQALARDAAKLDEYKSDRLTITTGDAADAEAIKRTITGADAVINTLGVTPTSRPDTGRTAMRHLLAAMRELGITRLVAISGAATVVPGDQIGWQARLASGLVKKIMPAVVEDKQAEADLLYGQEGAGIDWTIVRPPRLTDGPARGHYQLTDKTPGLTAGDTRRADVAAAMLDLALGKSHVRRSPYVSR